MLKRLHFLRIEDISHTSGCGVIADGVIFDDGKVVVHWIGEHSCINIYQSLKDVEWIHGHEGRTKIIIDD